MLEATQATAKEWKALLKAIAVPTLALVAMNVVSQRESLEGVDTYVRDILPSSRHGGSHTLHAVVTLPR